MPYKPILWCTVALSLWASPLFASTQEELEQTQKAIEQSKEKQQEFSKQTQKAQAELATLQENLVTLATSIQKAETALSELEQQLRSLNSELQEKTLALSKEQKHLELLVEAALSLSRTPAEAMMMMPGNTMDSMKTARALAMASDDIRKETQIISKKMEALNALKQKTAEQRDAVSAKQIALSKDHKTLESQIAERSTLLKTLGEQSRAENDKLAHLSKKAADIKDLIASVEQEEEANRQEEKRKQQNHNSHTKLRSFESAQGHMRRPAAGEIIQTFASTKGANTNSKGIVIRTRTHADVVSPYDGEVVFTGPFLAYGQMVIIRHSDGFHTLLAGLVKIDVDVGQFLLEGEPIGAMGDDESGNKLYIELRQNNQPVDPALWISGLNKKH